jgi:hypothetical protein
MTITPPAMLATDGASLKQTQTHATANGVSNRVDQRILRGGDHLTADRQEHEPLAELCCPEQEQLERIDGADIHWRRMAKRVADTAAPTNRRPVALVSRDAGG